MINRIFANGGHFWAEPPMDFSAMRNTTTLSESPSAAFSVDTELEAIRGLLEHYRITGSEDAFEKARLRLESLMRQGQSPAEALVYKAAILQKERHYKQAEAYIDLALLRDPKSVQASITKFSIALEQGKYSEARMAAIALLNRASSIISTTAVSLIGSLTGKAEPSYRALTKSLVLSQELSTNNREMAWARTVAAQIASRMGKKREAEVHYFAAMQLESPCYGLVNAYADFLLEEKRFSEAIELLDTRLETTGTLVRLALAWKGIKSKKESVTNKHTVEEHDLNYEQSNRCFSFYRNLRSPLRPSSQAVRYLLHIENNIDEALPLAIANWECHKDPIDAQLLLECAVVARDASKAKPVVDWMRRWKIEDVKLHLLGNKLGYGFSTCSG